MMPPIASSDARTDTVPGRWIAAAAALLSSLYCIRIWDYDVWWHLATGRWIVEHRAIPAADPFSFTVRGAAWRYVNWLGDLVLYGAFAAGGPAGLVVLKIACAFGVLLLLGLALRALGVSRAPLLATLALVAVLIQFRQSTERTLMLGGVLLAASLFVAARWWVRRDLTIVLLAPLVLVWLPVHGNALVGAAIPGLVTAALLATPARPRRDLLLAAATTVACAAAIAATRSGRETVASIFDVGHSSVAASIIVEWARPTLRSTLLYVPVALTILGAAACARRWRERALPLGLALLALAVLSQFERYVHEAMLLAAPAIALGAHDLHELFVARNLRLARAALPLAIAVLIPGVHLAIAPPFAFETRFGLDAENPRYPDDTLPTLLTLPPGRTMNDYSIGGWLLFHRIPGGVFADGRLTALYTDADIARFILPAAESDEGLERIADAFDVTYGLCTHDSALGARMMRSPRWLPVRHGRGTTLFVRTARTARDAPAPIPLVEPLRWTPDPTWLAAWYDGVAADPARSALLELAVVATFRASPDSNVLKGALPFLRERHPALAMRLMERLEREAAPP